KNSEQEEAKLQRKKKRSVRLRRQSLQQGDERKGEQEVDQLAQVKLAQKLAIALCATHSASPVSYSTLCSSTYHEPGDERLCFSSFRRPLGEILCLQRGATREKVDLPTSSQT